MLLAELLDDKDHIKNVDHAITIRVWSRLPEVVSDLHQIQDIDPAIAVDIGSTWGLEVHFASEVGEQAGFCLNQMSTESGY